MRWAKEHAAARYNLANSGLLGCSTDDLVLEPGDVQVNGASRDGYPPLLAAIAERYGVTPGQVVTAPGTSGANFLAFAALIEPGDEVLVERPTYEPLLAALGFLGARVRRFERRFEDGYRLDLDEIRARITDRTRLVVLANPHNPSGVLLPPEEVAGLARLAERAGAHLLVDEVYRDIWFEDAPAEPRPSRPQRPRHQQPDQELRPLGIALRLDPLRAGRRPAALAHPGRDAGRGLGAERHAGARGFPAAPPARRAEPLDPRSQHRPGPRLPRRARRVARMRPSRRAR